jgi:endonuclease/exonuclease/phosphatase family metal-dependent hydrolase
VAADASILRVATFNIHGGKGHDNRRDLGRIAHDIETVDFVGLNEVEGPFLLERHSQVEQLAKRLQLPWLFAPAERRWLHYEFGNGVLSRLPVDSWERVPLPRSYGKGFRNLVLLRSSFGGKPLNIVVTHIDRSNHRERAEQVRFVADYFLALPPPALLMGDLNTDGNDLELRRLLDSPGVVDSLSQVAGAPRHIDWILARGLVVRDAGMREVGASDHPALWAELELPRE